MKALGILFLLACAISLQGAEPGALLAQVEPTRQVNTDEASPRVMPLYEQGWEEGVNVGNHRSGKIGWFGLGLVGNVPFMWLPWVVEPRRPAKPSINVEEEFNSGYKAGYRAGWKNAHKAYYIAGAIVSTAAVTAVIVADQD